MVRDRVLGLGDFGWDWASQVQKDLRSVMGAPEKGRYSRIYCGGPGPQPTTRREQQRAQNACCQVLLSTLQDAYEEVAAAQGSPDPKNWKVYATCPDPSTCDEIVPNTAGAVDTPPFPWQNRGTFHQVDEISGHRQPGPRPVASRRAPFAASNPRTADFPPYRCNISRSRQEGRVTLRPTAPPAEVPTAAK
jgi:hypothetical protein